MELINVRGRRFLKSFSLLPSQVAPSHVAPPLFPSTQSFGQEPATSLRQIFPRLPKGYFTKIPIRSLPITNVPNHLQENLFTLCASGFLWQPPPIHPVTVFVTFGLFLSVTASAEVVGPHGAAAEKNPKYDATLLSFKSDKYTVAEHQKRGGGQYGVADKLL